VATEPEDQESDDEHNEVEIVDFDEEAEAAARIWNLFANYRVDENNEVERASGMITAAQIARATAKSEIIRRVGTHEEVLTIQNEPAAN